MGTTTENNVLMKFKDISGNVAVTYPITKKGNVIGLGDAIRNQSVTTTGTNTIYEATVSGITELTPGIAFIMIPHVTSAISSPKLNVNNLGEKFIHRRVSGSTTSTYSAKTSDDWLAAGKPIRVMYDGTYWIADMPVPYARDFMGTLLINNGGTGATTAAQARINLGIETTDGTVSSGNAAYAEVGEWLDGNPDAEDRIGYFVCIDNNTPGTTMRKATSSDDVRGVTVASPAFAGGCSSDKYTQTESSDLEADPDADSRSGLLPQYDYVAVMGIVPVIDDGTCVKNGRCMPNDSGIAAPVSGDYGYQVMDRIDDTHILVAVEPDADFQYKVKNYINSGISKADHRNLLDNSDFRNPVNQRGQSSYNSAGYTIDRWDINNTTEIITLASTGITVKAKSGLHGYFRTYLDSSLLFGKKFTFAVKLSNGDIMLCSGTYPTENPSTAKQVASSVSDVVNIIAEAHPAGASFQIRINNGLTATIEWAALYEGAYTAETLPEYRPKGYMVEALNCGALHVTTTATLSTTWSGSGPYTQALSVAGILSTDAPHIMPVYSTTNSTAITQKEAWACVSKAETSDGTITFTCFEEKPTTAIPIQIEVNR